MANMHANGKHARKWQTCSQMANMHANGKFIQRGVTKYNTEDSLKVIIITDKLQTTLCIHMSTTILTLQNNVLTYMQSEPYN